jgi:hypothetical protein
MLGFIIKRNAPRKIGLQFCSSAFVDRIMKFKLTDMKPEDISTQIGSFPSASSLVNSQNKLFIQLAAMLPEHELKKAKETYMKRAIELFLQPGSVGQHGDLLRQFIVKSHMANLFTPELNRLFITKTVLRLVREGKTEELSQLSIDVYINILESCVLNDLLDPSEIFDCTKYAVEKLKFADRPLRYLTTLIVAHSLILKKYKGKAPEQTYANLVDSCLMVVSQSLQRLKSLPAEDSFEALMLMTHTLACLEIFKGHSKFRVFDTTWQLLELDFDQLIKRHAAQISNFIKEGEEAELLPILEDLNSMGSLYVTEMVKAILLPAIVARLELNYRKTSSSLVAQIINLAFKLDSKFEVAPKFLSALKLSKDDSLTSLQNASVSLDIFSKQQLTDSMGPYLDQLEDFLQSVIRNPDTKSSQSQVKLLLTIFKQLVQLGRGSVKLFKVYFDFFKQREVLEQVGLIPVLVQLLPSVGAKTKKLAGAMTNTSDEQSANVLNVTQAINNEIRPSITEVIER